MEPCVTSTLIQPLLLVVDDDPDLRELLCELLEAEGYAVRTAADGAEGLAALATRPHPVLVLLDLMMPRVSGLEFLQQRRLDAVARSVPVLVLSAASNSAVGAAVSAGDVCGFFRKPLDADALLLAIARELRPVAV